MNQPSRVVYALDIGMYNLDLCNEVESSTTAAWCRLTSAPKSLYENIDCLDCTPDRLLMTFPDGSQAVCGRDIEQLARHISLDLANEAAVALGFEAPMWFPIALDADSHKLFYRRFDEETEERFEEERKRKVNGRHFEWYQRAGAPATIKSVSLGILLFRSIFKEITIPRISTNPHCWHDFPGSLTLFEAFVAGGNEKGHAYYYKLKCPDSVPKKAKNEWDAFTAAISWCGCHGLTSREAKWQSEILHESGATTNEVVSIWEIILSRAIPEVQLDGSLDCEVVGILNKNSGCDKPLEVMAPGQGISSA